MVTLQSEVRVMVTPEVRSGLWSHKRARSQSYDLPRAKKVIVTTEMR
jgi:hypothetical protein